MKITRSITIYVPGDMCNLRCEYCYVSNSKLENESHRAVFLYPIEHMIKAFEPERIGGIAEIGVIGAAETLMEDKVIELVHGLLRQNHVVAVVSNGTLSGQVDKLIDIENEALKNLIFKASLHYFELKKRSLLKDYFENIRKVIKKGGSAYPFLVISKEYLPYLEEIRELCIKELNNTPHCTPCMIMKDQFDIRHTVAVEPEITEELYCKVDKLFDSNVFRESVRFLDINCQAHYCYAGKWSYGVDMGTGQVCKCHGMAVDRNFFENVEEKFELNDPVACSCGIASCALQYNFFSLGLIPDEQGELLYGDLIYKEGLISEFLRDKLNVNLAELYGEDAIEEKYNKVLKEKNDQLDRYIDISRWMKDYLKKENVNTNLLWDNPFLQKRVRTAVNANQLIVIYGTGGFYEKYKFVIDFKIDFFIKTDAAEGEQFENLPVYRPEKLLFLESPFLVVIASSYRKEIVMKLEGMGFTYGKSFI